MRFDFVIFSRDREFRTACAATAPAAGKTRKQIREVSLVERRLRISELLSELPAPVGRRPQILARLVATAELIVGRALFLALQWFIGLTDFLGSFLSVLFLRHVSVIFVGEVA